MLRALFIELYQREVSKYKEILESNRSIHELSMFTYPSSFGMIDFPKEDGSINESLF